MRTKKNKIMYFCMS